VEVPALSVAGAGTVALASEAEISMTLPTSVAVFHVASHARTVIVNGTPVTCGNGAPVRPDVVPGAAASPGRSTCNRE
jgi:hypothetical protein